MLKHLNGYVVLSFFIGKRRFSIDYLESVAQKLIAFEPSRV